MEKTIMKESFVSVLAGKNIYATRLLSRWIILPFIVMGITNIGMRGGRVCVTVKLLSDRFKFSLSFPLCFLPYFKFEIPFTDIESIEFRKHFLKQGIFTLIPKLNSRDLICMIVRKPKSWLEYFKILGLRVDSID